ncbi:hypothetical protein ASPWEDRAFT_26117 [Aspergillus wentii DTO 134E9]|uniref:REJ domain-containing protein n=1 Tax=Aspergillus wentii DTO 134E9 TaxID=1073089 RepID=A0A1L9RNZ2_ASPWE|nr:uncharacterized protein ASPWEDRAFT_26117 [Aspergillus wentii DTO 134E9]KAI9934201.1 hypothetical protein MW887_005275 [Aspergillus wentii]OJJ36660.1 hypothetical protein ASPWEDRAFT_26117 [Aspergillus wentii DTO 134E9]
MRLISIIIFYLFFCPCSAGLIARFFLQPREHGSFNGSMQNNRSSSISRILTAASLSSNNGGLAVIPITPSTPAQTQIPSSGGNTASNSTPDDDPQPSSAAPSLSLIRSSIVTPSSEIPKATSTILTAGVVGPLPSAGTENPSLPSVTSTSPANPDNRLSTQSYRPSKEDSSSRISKNTATRLTAGVVGPMPGVSTSNPSPPTAPTGPTEPGNAPYYTRESTASSSRVSETTSTRLTAGVGTEDPSPQPTATFTTPTIPEAESLFTYRSIVPISDGINQGYQSNNAALQPATTIGSANHSNPQDPTSSSLSVEPEDQPSEETPTPVTKPVIVMVTPSTTESFSSTKSTQESDSTRKVIPETPQLASPTHTHTHATAEVQTETSEVTTIHAISTSTVIVTITPSSTTTSASASESESDPKTITVPGRTSAGDDDSVGDDDMQGLSVVPVTPTGFVTVTETKTVADRTETVTVTVTR